MENIKKNNDNQFYTVKGYSMKDSKDLTPCMEDYLEMIYRQSNKDGYTRIKDLSKALNVKASSATKIVQKLSQYGYINYEKYSVIRLNKKGKEYGEFLLKRHEVVENFLKFLGVDETLMRDTELLEHQITPYILKELKGLLEFFQNENLVFIKYQEFKTNSKK